MNLLGTSHYYFSHSIEAWCIIGIICTLLGLLVGWLAWRHCRAQAERIERMNEDLKKQYKKLKEAKGN